MNARVRKKIEGFVNQNIDTFHLNRLNRIKKVSLRDILKRKNPYLFRAKNLNSGPELVASVMDAFLSSSEEELFGQFLEDLAIYIAEITCGGHKSAAEGIDLEISREGVKFIIAIKSGPNWGNRSQYNDLKLKFKNAKKVLSQSRRMLPVQPVLGICYGKFKKVNTGEYLKIGGQCFWHFISGDENLYIDLIEPLGYEAKRHNDGYLKEKANTYNRFTKEFLDEFCLESGQIDWPRLVQFNSGNLT